MKGAIVIDKEMCRRTVRELCRVGLLHRYRISMAVSHLHLYRGQPELLEYLLAHGECSQVELSEALGVSPSALDVPRIKSHEVLNQLLFALEDEYGLTITITEINKRSICNGK